MGLTSRILMAASALAVAAWTHVALVRHLEASRPAPSIPLRKPLAELPDRLGDWHGVDIEPPSVFADEHFARVYRHELTGQEVTVNSHYSARAEDRKHDPLLCLGVAGFQEDPEWRESIPVEGHTSPIQRFRLHKPDEIRLAFYWHYTWWPADDTETSRLGKLYQQFHSLPSSVSISAFTPHFTNEDAPGAHEFVRLLDAALQSHIVPGAERGNATAPIMVIGTDGLRPTEHDSSKR